MAAGPPPVLCDSTSVDAVARLCAPGLASLVFTDPPYNVPPEEEAICEEHDFPVLRKPFLASDVMNQIRSRLTPAAGVGAR